MLAGGGDRDKLRGECFEAGSFGRSICSGRWGTFLVLQGEEDGGCHRLLPPPDRERGHTRPSALWGPCHGRGSQNPRAQPGARGTQKVPLRGGLSQIFHCDWHLSVAFTWRRSPRPPCAVPGGVPPLRVWPGGVQPRQRRGRGWRTQPGSGRNSSRAGGRGARQRPDTHAGLGAVPPPCQARDFSDAGPLSPGVSPVFSEVPAPSWPLLLFTVLHLTAGRGEQRPAGRGRS